jgi:hypothetical protein
MTRPRKFYRDPDLVWKIRRKKYPDPALSPEDYKKLATLVRKYGRELIAESALAANLALRGPGRPRVRGPSARMLAYYERLSLTNMLEQWAEEFRAKGSKQPYFDAAMEMYPLELDPEHNEERQKERSSKGTEGAFIAAYLKRVKKLRLRGRKEWVEYSHRRKKMSRKLGRPFGADPPWLRKFIKKGNPAGRK